MTERATNTINAGVDVSVYLPEVWGLIDDRVVVTKDGTIGFVGDGLSIDDQKEPSEEP